MMSIGKRPMKLRGRAAVREMTYFLELDRDFPKKGSFREVLPLCASVVISELVEIASEVDEESTRNQFRDTLDSIDYVETQLKFAIPSAIGVAINGGDPEEYDLDVRDHHTSLAIICAVRLVNQITRSHIYYALCEFLVNSHRQLNYNIRSINCTMIDDTTVEITVR